MNETLTNLLKGVLPVGSTNEKYVVFLANITSYYDHPSCLDSAIRHYELALSVILSEHTIGHPERTHYRSS